jgi:hypothetical protein
LWEAADRFGNGRHEARKGSFESDRSDMNGAQTAQEPAPRRGMIRFDRLILKIRRRGDRWISAIS